MVFRHRQTEGEPFVLRLGSLEVDAGKVVACIGPSGSGKSTLLDLIAGILSPEQGSIRVAGFAMHELDTNARRRVRIEHIGLVFQTLALVDYLTAFENIVLPSFVEPTIATRAELKARAQKLAADLEIDHLLRRRPAKLSQGERQRVAICRALVTRPAVLLCDEPTGNLDPVRSERTLDLLLEAGRTSGAAVMMATHDHSLLGRFDTVLDMAELRGGRP
ncbi:MAG TPA: ATP-binding cassette domain-containing protein [Phycisphaerales bacterium]|nr:ATP-binding cassette domain-containing protein [Phycisphaerales bacterium]